MAQFQENPGAATKLRLRPQLKLWDIFVVISAVGVALGALQAFHLFGAAFLFVAAVVVSINLALRAETESGTVRANWYYDLIWGVLMPVICLLCDPGFFKQPVADSPLSMPVNFNLLAYCTFGLQMVAMLIWLIAAPKRAAGVLAGIFVVGVGIAILVGLLLLPASAVGILVLGLGIMGFTPFLTAGTFYRRARDAMSVGRSYLCSARYCLSLLVGMLLATTVPVLLTWLVRGGDGFRFRMYELLL